MSDSTKQPSIVAYVVNTIAVEHTDCCIVDESRTTHPEGIQAAKPAEDLRRLVLGYRVSQAISVAAELGEFAQSVEYVGLEPNIDGRRARLDRRARGADALQPWAVLRRSHRKRRRVQLV
jgi:hypothetical protein